MKRFLSLPRAGADKAGAGAKAAMEFTGQAAGAGIHGAYAHGAQLTENTGDVVNNLYRRAEVVQRKFFRVFVSEEDGADPENVIQMDGSFGNIGPGYVLLLVETAEHWELKLAKFVSTFFTLVITGVIILLLVIKVRNDFSNLVGSSSYFIWNVAVAGTCLALCVTTLATFAHRYFKAKRAGLEWSQRRWRLSLQSLVLLGIQVVNLSCMIGGLGPLVRAPCKWRNHASAVLGFVQWTCWNTTFMVLVAMSHSLTILRQRKANSLLTSSKRVKSTELVLDAPIHAVHWDKFLIWVFFEIWPVLLMWSFWDKLLEESGCETLRDAGGGKVTCVLSQQTVAFVSMLIVSCGVYMIVYLFFSARTQDDLESRSYHEMKFVRVAYGVQHSYVLPLFLVLMFSIIVLLAVNMNSCWTYVEQWLGMSAWQVTGTICACTLTYFCMPVVGRDRAAVRSLIQDFCWTRDAERGEQDARDEIVKRFELTENLTTVTKAPMFCVETCLRHLYVANYVYSCETDVLQGNDEIVETESGGLERFQSALEDPDEPPDEPPASSAGCSETSQAHAPPRGFLPGIGNIDNAVLLWGAEGYRIVAEKKTDTLALVLWSSTRLVLAFKGTSSAQNVKTDLNVLKSPHEPKRKIQVRAGFTKSMTVPQTCYVHRGFYKSWRKEGFDGRIKSLVRWYIETYHKDTTSESPVELHVTGHSLGGALATLAAFDLTKEFNVDTTVYTFGQPRVGNKAFAVDYDATVPKHFSVAHGQDPVARVPKGSYKKNGIPVHTSGQGDIVVSPSTLEKHILNGTPELKDHFLESYRKAWMSSIKQQFGPKALDGLSQSGRVGATTLANLVELDLALMGSHLDIHSLESPESYPLSEEDIAKIEEKREKQERIRARAGDGANPGCAPTNLLPGCCGTPSTHQ